MTDFYFDAATGLSLDFGGLQKPLDVTGDLAMLQKALEDMQALEGGAIANPDEQRMVGHYWLRAPKLAPTPEIAQEIEQVQAAIWQFAEQVHAGQIVGCKGQPFRNVLVVGLAAAAWGRCLFPRLCKARPTGCACSSLTTPTLTGWIWCWGVWSRSWRRQW